ncbi:MAG: hypothetical protein GXP16_14335 [Gammaproteobacteria bacterium]|nr:hypothetical protein [Gammaproteobacteria bacterium]
MVNSIKDDHWLERPKTVKRLWYGFIILLVLSVVAQLYTGGKGYFGIDGWVGFGAWFGFLACVVLVIIAKILGKVLKREESFYGESDD